jgi:serine/threonine-protein kinase
MEPTEPAATEPSGTEMDPDLGIGQVVGEYQVEGKLGQGGFGAVFKAVHPLIGKLVAIKVLSTKFSADRQMVSRFIAEAKAVNQIRHRNIIDIFSFGQLPDGRHYYVMEYIDGEPLDRRVARGRISLVEAVTILEPIAKALDAAHAKGVAHRDLKAENIFLGTDSDGAVFPKLLDFGIAKLMGADDEIAHKTQTGAPMGTPYYMSPEQTRGRGVDHRTDYYAFGVLVYVMLTAKFPLDGDDYMTILMRQVTDEPEPASSHVRDLPARVDQVIAWLMRKAPDERPPDLMTAVRALQEATEGLGTSPTVAPTTGPVEIPAHVSTPQLGKATTTSPALGKTQATAETMVPGHRMGGRSRRLGALALAGGAVLALGAIVVVMAMRSGSKNDHDDPGSGSGSVAIGGSGSGSDPVANAAAVEQAKKQLRAAENELYELSQKYTATHPSITAARAKVEQAQEHLVRAQMAASGSAEAPPDAAPAAPAAIDAAATTPVDVAVSKLVTITLPNVPSGTEVRIAGQLYGTAPEVQVPRGKRPVILILTASGYLPGKVTVTPDRDLGDPYKLHKRHTTHVTRPPHKGSGGSATEPTDDIINFPKEKPGQ